MNSEPTALQARQAPQASGANVWAVVVTYNPSSDLETNLGAVVPQVKRLIIVDNQSSPTNRQIIEKVAATYQAASIWNQENPGIASALNAGVGMALDNAECQWILMLDQDSRVSPDFVAICLDAYEACPFKSEVALVGANYELALRPPAASWQAAPQFREIASLMTSGTLAKASVFSSWGGFDESFFMDYVDHDFCFRVRQHGLRIIQVSNAVLQHRLGAPTSHLIFGRHLVTSNYSPNRRYHNARNRMIVYRRYLFTETFWIVCDWFRWLRETVKMMLVEPDRRTKLAAVMRGAWDGFKAPKWSRGTSVTMEERQSGKAAK